MNLKSLQRRNDAKVKIWEAQEFWWRCQVEACLVLQGEGLGQVLGLGILQFFVTFFQAVWVFPKGTPMGLVRRGFSCFPLRMGSHFYGRG